MPERHRDGNDRIGTPGHQTLVNTRNLRRAEKRMSVCLRLGATAPSLLGFMEIKESANVKVVETNL
jgi:hypothetical protein